MRLPNPLNARFEIFQYADFDDMENYILMTSDIGEDISNILGESIDRVLFTYWRYLGAI